MSIDKFFSRTFYDFFTEFVERIRVALLLGNLHSQSNEHIPQRIEESPTQPVEMKSAMNERLIPNGPETWFIKLVEDCLRKLPDSMALGGSQLTGYAGIKGESEVARGKQLQQLLHEAVESLRPAGVRPASAPPKAWFNYAVLYDAYVAGIRNRDVMARLNISEGTFNRTRRIALRGVAIWLIEEVQNRKISPECECTSFEQNSG